MPVCLLSKPTLTKLMHAMEKIEARLNPVTKIVSCSDNFCKSSFQKPFHRQWSSEADISGAGGHDHYTDCYFREPRLFPSHFRRGAVSLIHLFAFI